MHSKNPPAGIHVPGTHRGEALARKKGREPGRQSNGSGSYRTARDSTSLNADKRSPIDPRMPNIPPA